MNNTHLISSLFCALACSNRVVAQPIHAGAWQDVVSCPSWRCTDVSFPATCVVRHWAGFKQLWFYWSHSSAVADRPHGREMLQMGRWQSANHAPVHTLHSANEDDPRLKSTPALAILQSMAPLHSQRCSFSETDCMLESPNAEKQKLPSFRFYHNDRWEWTLQKVWKICILFFITHFINITMSMFEFLKIKF